MKPTNFYLSLAIFLSAIVLLTGCGRFGTTIYAEEFDRRCTADDQCRVIYSGDHCDGCTCSNAAIHVDEWERYRQMRDDVSCFREPTSLCDCAPAEAYCDEGTCAARENWEDYG